jgi:uncharacterized protein (TIGR00106 family)
MSVLIDLGMFPVDKGDSLSTYVARLVSMIDETKLPYKMTPMSTIIETQTLEQALKVVSDAYKLLEPDCSRVYSVIKLDIRKGRDDRLQKKIESVEKKMGKKART